jgi:hypothetical protein
MGKFAIAKYEAPAKANEWADDVAELKDAVDQDETFAATVELDGKTHQADLRSIRDAAKKLDRTVRIISVDESKLEVDSVSEKGRKTYKGIATYKITLRPKVADGRGRKPAETADAKPEGKSSK